MPPHRARHGRGSAATTSTSPRTSHGYSARPGAAEPSVPALPSPGSAVGRQGDALQPRRAQVDRRTRRSVTAPNALRRLEGARDVCDVCAIDTNGFSNGAGWNRTPRSRISFHHRPNSASSSGARRRAAAHRPSVNHTWNTVPRPTTRDGTPGTGARAVSISDPRARASCTRGREQVHRGRDRRHLDHVGVVRAGVRVAAVADRGHHLVCAADRRDREATPQSLGHRGDVGHHAEELLATAAREPEPRDHLVEVQQRAVLAVRSRRSRRKPSSEGCSRCSASRAR